MTKYLIEFLDDRTREVIADYFCVDNGFLLFCDSAPQSFPAHPINKAHTLIPLTVVRMVHIDRSWKEREGFLNEFINKGLSE